MHNVAEKITFVELVERLARLRRFLLLEHQAGDPSSRDVIAVFNWAIGGILTSLDPVASILALDSPLNESDRVACARKLATAFSYFDEMHLRLAQVRGGWVKPETHVFIGKVLEFMPRARRPKDVSVILLNEYSFESEDLASHARNLLSAEPVPFDSVSDRPSVSLPKAERDNPLYWADLVHECGHIDQDGIDELLNVPDLIPTGADRRDVLENWAEEFYCDLFAVKILGPAYLASFSASALIATGLDAGEFGSETHPPDIVRICLMLRMLEKKNLSISLTRDFKEFGSVARLFYTATEQRNEIERLHLASDQSNDELLLERIPLTEFTDRIIERIDDAVRHERELKADDFRRTPQLAERLAQGILIGSSPDGESLEMFKAETPIGKRYGDHNQLECCADFTRAKNAIQETRTSPWEILNAGWLHKVETLYPFSFLLFFNGVGSVAEKIESFDARLLATDEVLLKSIEVSHIHEIFERKEPSDGAR